MQHDVRFRGRIAALSGAAHCFHSFMTDWLKSQRMRRSSMMTLFIFS
jgi:hypothetical protein